MTDDTPHLEGMHHITMITGDAQANVDFYAGLLGLRMVKQTVNFDAPDMYHLYFGDEHGSPGSLLTWFEIRGARRGRAGAGMVHRIELAVASDDALDFWQRRLDDAGHPAERLDGALRLRDYDGLEFDIVVASLGNPPQLARHADVPEEHAIIGVEGARAFPRSPWADEPLLHETLRFQPRGDTDVDAEAAAQMPDDAPLAEHVGRTDEYRVTGRERTFRWAYDPTPAAPGVPGAGTVHHIAWCSHDDDHLTWQSRVHDAGLHVTPVQDRDYFRSIYFRMPSGVLFEIATVSPGFAVDEDPDHLGEQLRVPKMHANLRDRIEQLLTPLRLPAVR